MSWLLVGLRLDLLSLFVSYTASTDMFTEHHYGGGKGLNVGFHTQPKGGRLVMFSASKYVNYLQIDSNVIVGFQPVYQSILAVEVGGSNQTSITWIPTLVLVLD